MSHLRRAWRKRFPEIEREHESIDEIEYLDEQEQEQLIALLQQENELINKRYKFLFTTVTLVQTPVYLIHPILRLENHGFLGLLALTSLLVSTYIIYITPISPSLIAAATALAANNDDNGNVRFAGKPISKLQLIMLLNFTLSLIISVTAYIRLTPITGIDYLWFSPLGSFVSILAVRRWMREGDTAGLEQFRYKYKGA
ncbi:hypothetical protein V1514DRAFT_302173 [Lipomyces japonicus]|uniref:uncharacterized protein n=1 Tax=Lipomyces japonicus TaxID=56871 RepID=UPI0034CD5C6C